MLTISLERAAEAFSICKNKSSNDFFPMQVTYYLKTLWICKIRLQLETFLSFKF